MNHCLWLLMSSLTLSRVHRIDAVYDCGGQWDAYNHLAPIRGKRVLQVGGKGIHAIKFILAGVKEAWLLSPMIGELINKVFSNFKIIHHGALLRYPLLVLNKFGVTISINTAWRANRLDDFVSDLLPGFRNIMGGSVSLICKK